MNITIKVCEYCSNEFETSNSRKKYCSDTCKTYASQVRTGKRDPLPEIEDSAGQKEISPEQQAELLNQLQRMELDIENTQSQKRELYKTLESLNKKSDRLVENEIEHVSYQLEAIAFKSRHEEEKKLERKMHQLESQKEEIKKYNEIIDKQREEIEEQIYRNPIKVFRKIEKRNDFIKKHFLNSNELKGKDIVGYQNVQTRYPFNTLTWGPLAILGTPLQPFIASITGQKETGKSVVGVLLSLELIKWLNAKVLYVADFQNKDKVMEYYAMEKVKSDNLTLNFAESIHDIEKALSKDNYEFLFIDSNHSFKLNFTNIKKIQKEHKKLSVFCISRNDVSSIVDASEIEIKTDAESNVDHSLKKRAWANVYINGVHQEDWGWATMLDNSSGGFQIFLE